MKIRYLICLLFTMILFVGCKKEPIEKEIDEEEELSKISLTNFEIAGFEFKTNKFEIIGTTQKKRNVEKLKPKFEATGVVTVNNIVQYSGISEVDFSNPVTYVVTNENGRSRSYKVSLKTFTGLPILYITTKTDIPHHDYVEADYEFFPNGNKGQYFHINGQIKGHGNSTWGEPKKPYKIKFDKKQSMCGEKPFKKWLLMANYIDKTLIRTELAMRMGEAIGMEYTSSHNFIEVYLNGVHKGNYLLMDDIKTVAEGRLDLEKLENTETNSYNNTGTYLLEIDERAASKDAPYFWSLDRPHSIEYPDDPSEAQINYIKKFVQNADNVLNGSNYLDKEKGFWKYFDAESMIKWGLINELFRNVDAQRFSSIYYYKKRGDDHLYYGPLWDFDMGAANARHNSKCHIPEGWYIFEGVRFKRMCNSSDFRKLRKEIWMKYRDDIYNVIMSTDDIVESMAYSIELNFKLWPDFEDPSEYVMPGHYTHKAHVDCMKDFLVKRYKWMDENM